MSEQKQVSDGISSEEANSKSSSTSNSQTQESTNNESVEITVTENPIPEPPPPPPAQQAEARIINLGSLAEVQSASVPTSITEPPPIVPAMPNSSNNHGPRHTFNRTFRFISNNNERRGSNDPPRGTWRDNLNNVFQEIFVQHSRSPNNPLTQWLPERRNILLQNNNVTRGVLIPPTPGLNTPPINNQSGNVSDSFVINVYEPVTMVAPVNTTEDASTTSGNNDEVNRQVHTHQQHVHHIHMDANNMPNPLLSNTIQPDNNNLNANRQPNFHHHVHPPVNIQSQPNSRSNSITSNQPNDDANVQDAFNHIPEARAMMDTFARYTPLVCILITKLCYDHLDGIIHFLALLFTFSHANWVVRQEISKQSQKRVIALIRELIFIIIALALVGFVLERKNIFLSLMFAADAEEQFSLKSLLFSVCMTDLVLKLLTIIIKIVITLMPPSIVEYKSRGKIYLMTESISQLYRSIAPIQPWLIFLFESYSGSEKIVGVILSAAYMVAKSTDLLDRIKFCKRSIIKLLQKTSYGTIPTKEQLQQCGGQCPICHDSFNSPVLLECNHIFCEVCVGTWFDREQTCPLCRAKIVDDPSYRDGATTFFLQLY